MEYKTVSEINEIVKYSLENNSLLYNICLKGEISNLKYHSKGHIYFSLKDENAVIKAVIFNAQGRLSFDPKDGDSVLVTGRINVYPQGGYYQIIVNDMNLDGLGNLYVLFEELKKKLSKEGLFDQSHKRRLPRFPEKVGVITAKEGAAIRDIISTINRRYPLCEIYLFPSLVQGPSAKDSIVKMIEKANQTDIDVLIVGRGGGSIEDLWPFNEEIVARAIYNSKVPVVSAVGHEIDFTISDFAADMRAPTPTAAAELVVKNIEDINTYLIEAENRLNNSIKKIISSYESKLEKYKTNYILNNPLNFIDLKKEKFTSLKEKLILNYKNYLVIKDNKLNLYKTNYILNNPDSFYKNLNNKIENLKIKLNLLNPNNILEKGYSIIKIDDKIIKDIKDVKVKDNINIILKNGKIDAEVKGVK